LVQHVLVALADMVAGGTFSIETVVEKTAHAPATLFSVERRGYLREGYWADLVLLDPNAATEVRNRPIHSKCGWSPFEEFTFRGAVRATFVNGHLVYRDGEFLHRDCAAALTFDRR